MIRLLFCFLIAFLSGCSSTQDELNIYIKSRDTENDRAMKLLLNNELIIEMELADNAVEDNYSMFKFRAPHSSDRLIKAVLEDSIVKEVKIPSRGSYDVFIIANSTQLIRDYNNPEIRENLRGKGTSDFRGFADSLYDNGIIEQKFLEIHKDSVIEVSFRRI